MAELTQSRLKELMDYDSSTGIFTWVIGINQMKAGDVAGTKHSRGYVCISIGGELCLAHRLAFLYMDGEFPPNQVDHINGIRNDNRWLNLRHATAAQNARNQKAKNNSASGYKGVYWSKDHSKWRVQIKRNYKQIHVGMYVNKSDAIIAYNNAAEKHHGDFAKLNEVKI